MRSNRIKKNNRTTFFLVVKDRNSSAGHNPCHSHHHRGEGNGLVLVVVPTIHEYDSGVYTEYGACRSSPRPPSPLKFIIPKDTRERRKKCVYNPERWGFRQF